MFYKLFLLVLVVLFFLAPQTLSAQTPPGPNILVTLAPLNRQTNVELAALTVDADLFEQDGHTFAQGTLTWKARNTDPANETTIVVGFPEWASASATFDPTKFTAFRVLVDNEAAVLAPAVADVIYGEAARDINWYTFELTLAPDEKKTITAEFTQDLGDGVFPRFTYASRSVNPTLTSSKDRDRSCASRVGISWRSMVSRSRFESASPFTPPPGMSCWRPLARIRRRW